MDGNEAVKLLSHCLNVQPFSRCEASEGKSCYSSAEVHGGRISASSASQGDLNRPNIFLYI